MPTAPPRACSAQPCPHYAVTKGRCANHASQLEVRRGSSTARGYDSVYRRARKMYLTANPLCVDCLAIGQVVKSEQLHHRVKFTRGGERLDPDNFMALCEECHRVRTDRGE